MLRILIIGAAGQIGTELTEQLSIQYGKDRIVGADLNPPDALPDIHDYVKLDVLDKEALAQLIDQHDIKIIYNLAAVLSATAERIPEKAWNINMSGLFNVLDLAREKKLERIFWPSSIAVFGNSTPKADTPQQTITEPSTVYGISKLAGERWCEYYHEKYGVDVRSIRYPGLISYRALPGGGTTDYAVEIYYKALEEKPFQCFLNPDTKLPMMFMPDAVRATIELMQAPPEDIKVRSSYNLAAFSISPAEAAESIRKQLPDFEITYEPDYRENIARTWPQSIDDSKAREDWNWKHEYDVDSMTEVMLRELSESKVNSNQTD